MRAGVSRRMTYTAGRGAAVLTRPACLFLANNYLAATVAQQLSVALIGSSLAMIAIAADSHRVFYLGHYAEQRRSNGLVFWVYAASLLLLTAVGVCIVSGIAARSTGSVVLVAAAVTYFSSEKLADEMLRARLFEADFNGWGRSILVRSALQIVAILATIAGMKLRASGSAIVLALAAANFLVFVPQLPKSALRLVSWRGARVLRWLVPRAVRLIAVNWFLWVIAVLGAGIGYLDRIVALSVEPAILPVFVLVVMCFSIVQMAVDFYYVSIHRREFLQQRVPIRAALTSAAFLRSLALGLVVAFAAAIAVLTFSRGGRAFPTAYIFMIAVLQASFAAATIPQQILYWHHEFGRILRIEVSFWLGLAVVAAVGLLGAMPAVAIYATVAVGAVARLSGYVVFARRRTSTLSRIEVDALVETP